MEVFEHGSDWVRADFHLHTRRDPSFRYDGAENYFVGDYIAALKKANIQVGVITNHNRFDRDEFFALRRAAAREEIGLLPGVELSVQDGANGIHFLIVFHESWISNKENTDHVNVFLQSAFAGIDNYDGRTPKCSNDNIEGTLKRLNDFHRPYFVVGAHVESSNGFCGEDGLKGGRIQALGANQEFQKRLLAFQRVKSDAFRQKVSGWLSWYPSEVEGSDPKCLEQVGQGEHSYLKIGAYSFDAIRFALRSKAMRVANDPIDKPHGWIRSVRFEGGIFDGERIPFSKRMNCLIGVRGSGKSAVLECLRYALDLNMPTEMEIDQKYKVGLVAHAMGSGGKVTVELADATGNLFEVRRIYGQRSDLYFNGEPQPGVKPPLSNPLCFGQKELGRREDGFEQSLIERLIQGKDIDDIRHRRDECRGRVLDALHRLGKFKDVQNQLLEYGDRKKNIEFQLTLFKQYGIEDQLKRQIRSEGEVQQASRAVEGVSGFLKSFNEFITEQKDALGAISQLSSVEQADRAAKMNDILSRLKDMPVRLDQIFRDARVEFDQLEQLLAEFRLFHENLKEEFADIERKMAEKIANVPGLRPDTFVKLNGELQRVNMMIAELEKAKGRESAVQTELCVELDALRGAWHDEYMLIKRKVEALNAAQQALSIEVDYKGDGESLLAELKRNLAGSRIHEQTLRTVLTGRSDFVDVYQALDKIVAALGSGGLVFREYFERSLGSLLTWQPRNAYRIFYHGKNIREHSLGQQASALMLFILGHGENDLIVIDQPEDDLDNQTIYEDVIRLLSALKNNTQFVFATHNPNFPVLGDSEQVVACEITENKGQFAVGSIDDDKIQAKVVRIMEGGSEAFKKRKEIYETWKQ